MTFVHEDAEFQALLGIVAHEKKIAPALVEKDYWVTHTLWALHERGLGIWFKGGTSLSKGFDLINRFSEDLDLMVEPGAVAGLPEVQNWTGKKPRHVEQRRAFFAALGAVLDVPGVRVEPDTSRIDHRARTADYLGHYPGELIDELDSAMTPFVRLEFGHARVVPFTSRLLSSFVHDHLENQSKLGEYTNNRPTSVRCIHPLVTLFEKLDAMDRRYARGEMEADTFVRHYEDAARIVQAADRLPECQMTPAELVSDMQKTKDIKNWPSPDMPALQLTDVRKREAIQLAYDKTAPMFWGPRIPLDDACAIIRSGIESMVPPSE